MRRGIDGVARRMTRLVYLGKELFTFEGGIFKIVGDNVQRWRSFGMLMMLMMFAFGRPVTEMTFHALQDGLVHGLDAAVVRRAALVDVGMMVRGFAAVGFRVLVLAAAAQLGDDLIEFLR